MSDQPGAAVEPGGLVRVTRSGGFAGLTLSGEVDLDRLAGPDLTIWQNALRQGFTPLAGHQPAPDRFVYRVHSEQTGLDVTVGDHELPDDLRTLLDQVVHPPTRPGSSRPSGGGC
jgi:hypothetical protein